jgi:hypothetical protein
VSCGVGSEVKIPLLLFNCMYNYRLFLSVNFKTVNVIKVMTSNHKILNLSAIDVHRSFQ